MAPASTLTQNPKFKDTKKLQKTLTAAIYILQILGLATFGITLIAATIINFVQKPNVKGTWLQSHSDWQLDTALHTLSAALIGAMTLNFGIGHFLLIFAALWLVYRVVQGWLRFIGNQPMEK